MGAHVQVLRANARMDTAEHFVKLVSLTFKNDMQLIF